MIENENTLQTPQAPTKKKLNEREIKRTIFIVGMLALPIIQFLVFFVYVNFDTIVMTFQLRTLDGVQWSFINYRTLLHKFTDPEMLCAIRNSLFLGLNDLVLLLISVVFAYFFYKKVRGATFYRIIFFLPSIISIVIFVMVFKYMFDARMGIVNKILEWFGNDDPPSWLTKTSPWLLPLIMGYCLWVGTGYNILIMGGAMGNLPEDVMEYSRLEGLNYPTELFLVVIPMIWPTISVGILSSVTTVFTLFLQVELMTENGGTFYQATTIAFMINNVVKGGVDLEWAATLGIGFTVLAIPVIIVVRKVLDKVNDYFGV